jgi:glycosyltransferase involved in cell wall biosynthesis
MNKPLCLVMAPVGTSSGYGARSRDLVTALINLDKYEVLIYPTMWGATPNNALEKSNPEHNEIIKRLLPQPQLSKQPDLFIQVTVPSEFQSIGKYNIGVTAGIETTVAAAEWIEGINRMDLVITSSDFAKEVFEACAYEQMDNNTNQKVADLKVQKPIEVLLEGVRLDKYFATDLISKSIVEQLSDVKEKFCFLFVGHWLQGDLGADRKNVGMLVKTFLESFKNKAKHNQPALILKTSGADYSPIDKEALIDKLRQIYASVAGHDLPNVYLIHGDLTDEEMNSLYNHPKVKAHITFTRGEGFGRPLAEAALSKKPIIATNYSAHAEFLKESVLLPGNLESVHPSAVWDKMILAESKWFTVDYGYASTVMKHIVDNYKDYEVQAKKQATLIKKEWNFDVMTTKLGEILDKHVPEFPTQIPINIPQLKKIELPKLEKAEEQTT